MQLANTKQSTEHDPRVLTVSALNYLIRKMHGAVVSGQQEGVFWSPAPFEGYRLHFRSEEHAAVQCVIAIPDRAPYNLVRKWLEDHSSVQGRVGNAEIIPAELKVADDWKSKFRATWFEYQAPFGNGAPHPYNPDELDIIEGEEEAC